MNLGHPILEEMLKLGCSDQKKVLLGFQTYLELCEAYKLEDVQYHYNSQLDHIYLSALNEGEKQFYLPIKYSDSITPLWMKEASSLICNGNERIYLVLRDTDTSHVFYEVTMGLYEPLHPDATKELKATEEQKLLIDSEVKRMIPNLLEEARNKTE